MGLIHEKNRGRKSRDTASLSGESNYLWDSVLYLKDVGGNLVDHKDVDADAGYEPEDGGAVDPGQEQPHRPQLEGVALTVHRISSNYVY